MFKNIARKYFVIYGIGQVILLINKNLSVFHKESITTSFCNFLKDFYLKKQKNH